jgi:effector-binding domain-containing protein
MADAPEIVARGEEPYMSIRAQVKMGEIAEFAMGFGELFGWLGAHWVAPAGPPFFRYNIIDMERHLDMEAGVTVAATVEGDDVVTPGVLPAGRYATVTYVGHPQGLFMATKDLLEWGAGQGLRWDTAPGEHGEQWGSRLEFYLTDPNEEPDMSKWVTQLAFRLAD